MSEDHDHTDEDAQANDQRNGFSFTRRGMLTAGATGLGLAGASGAAGAQQDGGGENAPFAAEDHDHGGDYLGESEPVDRLDVRTIGGSRREGDTVYYDPDDPGPYADGQEALADVPRGGTLHIGHGVWDVATEGRLVVDRAINIQGSGWTKEPYTFGPDTEWHGTLIDNTGDQVIDEPVVEFKPADPDSPRLHNPSLSEVMIGHAGPTSPAVRVEALRSVLADNAIRCLNTAPIGILYEDQGYFARAVRNHIQMFTDTGIKVTGRGYAHEFYSNHVATNVSGATAALETQRHRTIIMGGEYALPSVDGGAAIRFYNPGGGRVSGGYVVEPGIEHTDIGIDIAPEGDRFDNIQLYHIMSAGLHNATAGVRFGNTANSKLLYPVVRTNGEIAQWSSDSAHCGVLTDAGNLAGCSYTDSGAYNPWVQVMGTAPDGMIAAFPTGVPTKVEYGVDENSPVFHDGQSWYTQASATQAYYPGGGSSGPDTVHYELSQKTITPDGTLETDGLSTWNLDEDGDLVELESGGSIGGNVWLGWDADNLYFQAAIDDPVHLQTYEPGNMFRGDNIQVAVAPGSDGWSEFLQYTIARNGSGTQVYGQIKPGSENVGERDFDAQVVRDDAAEQTRYEVAIPWTELDALGGFDPAGDEYLGVDWAILDADGENENNIDRFVRWLATGGSAITSGKEPDQLKVGHLVD